MWRATAGAGVWLMALLGPSTAMASPGNATTPTVCVDAARAIERLIVAPASEQDAARSHYEEAMNPDCQLVVVRGEWPGFAGAMLSLANVDEHFRSYVCDHPSPEALPAIATWMRTGISRGSYEISCGTALARAQPAMFDAIMVPRLVLPPDGCTLPSGAVQIGARLAPDERAPLLPVLAQATAKHAEGRDGLYNVVCAEDPPRAAAACREAAVLEPTWTLAANRRRAAQAIAPHVGLALAFGLACVLLWHRRRNDWPRVGMSALGTAAAAGAVTWIISSAPTPGEGAVNAIGTLIAMVVTPIVAIIAAVVAALIARILPSPVTLAWCLAMMVTYASAASFSAWNGVLDRLC